MTSLENDISNKDLYNLLKEVINKNEEIQKQNNSIKDEIKLEIRTTKAEIFEELESINKEKAVLKEENEKLKKRLLVCERKLKKYNLIIYGLNEEEEEVTEIQNFLEIINKKLNIDCRFADIRDIHRIGQKANGKNRPTAVEFINYKLKSEIFDNAKKLKGTGVFIANDYAPEDYEKRKILNEHLKKARNNNYNAVIKNNVLIINGDKFTYEDLKNQATNSNDAAKESITGKDSEVERTAKSDLLTKGTIKLGQQTTSSYKTADSLTQEDSTKKRKQIQVESESENRDENPVKRSNRIKNTNVKYFN